MRNFLQKISSKGKLLYATGMTALMCNPMVLTFCATNVNEGATPENVLGGVLDIVFKIAFWVGAVLGVSGVFQLVLAYKDDNADGQSRAVRLVVVALLLIGLRALVELTGLIS